MGSKKNKVNLFPKFIYLFVSYFFALSIFGGLHKHEEVNLHFHSENGITIDHTKAIDIDCALCPTLLAASLLLFHDSNFFYNNLISSSGVIQWKLQLELERQIGNQRGRAPPSLNFGTQDYSDTV